MAKKLQILQNYKIIITKIIITPAYTKEKQKTKIDNEQSKRLRRSTRCKQKSMQIYAKEIISGIWEGGE